MMLKKCLLPFKAFDSWLFSSGRPETLALLRIIFGSIAALSIALQAPYLRDYYSQQGLLPVFFLELWQWRGFTINPLKYLPFEFVYVVYGIGVLSALMMAAGWKTRLASWGTFLCLIFLHHRNPLILNSGDVLLRLTVLYLALSRSGVVWSIDAKRSGKTPPSEIPLWPQRLIQLQIALLYFAATWWKVQGALWKDGLVNWYVLRLEELARFPLPDFMLTEAMCRFTTWATLVIELALCTLVWFRPLRSWVLLSGVALHGGIAYAMNIPFFSLTTVSCYISFYTGGEVKKALQRLGLIKKA